jgi:hypothetical protein
VKVTSIPSICVLNSSAGLIEDFENEAESQVAGSQLLCNGSQIHGECFSWGMIAGDS